MHLIVVAACPAQAAHMPRINDLAMYGREEGDQRRRRAVRVTLWLGIFNNRASSEHPFAMTDTAPIAPPPTDHVAAWLCRCEAGWHQCARNHCLVFEKDASSRSRRY